MERKKQAERVAQQERADKELQSHLEKENPRKEAEGRAAAKAKEEQEVQERTPRTASDTGASECICGGTRQRPANIKLTRGT